MLQEPRAKFQAHCRATRTANGEGEGRVKRRDSVLRATWYLRQGPGAWKDRVVGWWFEGTRSLKLPRPVELVVFDVLYRRRRRQQLSCSS